MSKGLSSVFRFAVCFAVVFQALPAQAGEIARTGVYGVVEITFDGPQQGPADSPARDIDFWVLFEHENGGARQKVFGFWDGDGKGGSTGNIFKVRFCPTQAGRWVLTQVHSNRSELQGQKQGEHVTAAGSEHPGLWVPDPQSPGTRWYMRSDGSHQYIIGNTHYSFLSGYGPPGKPTGNDIAGDIRGNARYFKKLRFGLHCCRYPNPRAKPFFNDAGRATDSGDYSHRPNPSWFHNRADVAVRAAYEHDLIADLIICGPDTYDARSILAARANNGDATPWLKYVAARYGSYPNVWICLCNEFNIKNPSYSEEQIARFGRIIRRFLPHATPLSVHTVPRDLWPVKFDSLPPWNDHQIIQKKLRNLAEAADAIRRTWQNPTGKAPRNKPTINDELSYQGKGDRHSEQDTIEAHLGAFLGGGYGTTGEKPGSKLGQYFRGKFDPAEHTAADNLKFLREVIDENITFWKMAPDEGIFSNLDADFRAMAWPGREYVLGTNKARAGMVAKLPAGRWTVTCFDIIRKSRRTLASTAAGEFTFESPDSRAALFHFKKVEQ